MTEKQAQTFQRIVKQHFQTCGRHDLPWRQAEDDGQFDPYKIMVSELMLQQTQVNRVIPKYSDFLQCFPTIQALSEAQLGDVLRIWNGLGYNRRAKFLYQAAQRITDDYHGVFPYSVTELVKLPGIGANTAAAILVYSFNQPVAFLETNIRTVFIYHFLHDRADIPDGDILQLVHDTLDRDHPREWFWALMDYGWYLKQTIGNLNRYSKAYAAQSKFQGSRRQIRGQVLRLLGDSPQTLHKLKQTISDERLSSVVDDLLKEQLVIKNGTLLSL